MSHLDKEAKRMLSPQLDQLDNTKRPRSVYIVQESPGGTMREMDPSDNHPPVAGSSVSDNADAGPSTPAPVSESESPGSSNPKTLGSSEFTPKAKASSGKDASATPRAGPSASGKKASPKLDGLPQPPARVDANWDLAQEHLKTLTAREKLRKGIAMGFANSMVLGQGMPNNQPGPFAATLAAMMQRLDMTKSMDPELSNSHFLPPGPNEADMVNKPLTNKKPGAGEPSNFQDRKAQHFYDRLPAVVAASERLQVITGSANYRRFEPGRMPGRALGQIMLIENFDPAKDLPQVGKTSDNTSGLMAHLWSASARYGYKKLDLDTLVFKQNVKDNRLVLRSMPGRASSSEAPKPETVLSLDTHKGSITIYQTNIPLPDGRLQSWTWFRICKPMVDLEGTAPPSLTEMHHSVLVFAAPTSQIEKTGNQPSKVDENEKPQVDEKAPQSPSLGDFSQLKLSTYTKTTGRQLTLEWKFSKHGIPSFAISPLPTHIRARGFPPDFLWVDCAPYYTGRENSWWKTVRELAKNDHSQWEFIQQLMSGNLCFVEVKSKHDADWVTVPPEPRDSGSGNSAGDVKGKGKAVDHGNANHKANAAPNVNTNAGGPSASGPGVRRRGKKAKRASGLRNEVRQD
ncbi:hypothetical protein ACHAPT_007883 [Fusarium lateritium]